MRVLPRFGDADGAEVDREDVEGRFGAALERADHVAHQRIGAVSVHDLGHHTECARTREGPEHGHRQGFGRHADEIRQRADDRDHRVDSARRTEHPDCHEDRHQVGNDAQGDLEALLGARDERIVDAHAALPAIQDEAGDQGWQHPEGEVATHEGREQPG